ncbi:hypothetical protein [Anaeromyxobacter paludicola]|uniref:Porin n=1 Tax=Anaeromyxobacter paludicola TaxID=2918171 RepID=A0ABM7X9A3_9BACT|nr:hypothetical protein [Anaeromyxobacter paludicola]BDG08428.1 hypothetical protein AMPC_15410 [Anaeromyxobacter paludicola]
MPRRFALPALPALLALLAAPAARAQATAPAAEPAPKPAPLVTVTPYGFVHIAAYDNLGPFGARDYVGQALSTGDGGSVLFSARASRLGFRLALPEPVLGARVTGVIEADFKGGYVPTVFDTTTTTTSTVSGTKVTSTSTSKTTASAPSSSWYNALFRVRHANLKAAWKTDAGELSVVAGQDWTLIAPLAPATLAYAADQLFTNSGNLNRRAPQLKATYEGAFDAFGLNAAVAVISPSDNGTPVDAGYGDRARVPDLEGRVGLSAIVGGKKLGELGLAAHVNKRRYVTASNTDDDVTESVFAADAQLNLAYLTLQGEAFTGQGADDGYLGIAPGVNTAHGNGAVLTQGFWGQAVVRPIPLVDLLAGYGIEQPKVADLSGVAARTKNTTYGGGVIVNAHKAWKIGVESYKTVSWSQDAKGVATRAEAIQVALASKLDF